MQQRARGRSKDTSHCLNNSSVDQTVWSEFTQLTINIEHLLQNLNTLLVTSIDHFILKGGCLGETLFQFVTIVIMMGKKSFFHQNGKQMANS